MHVTNCPCGLKTAGTIGGVSISQKNSLRSSRKVGQGKPSFHLTTFTLKSLTTFLKKPELDLRNSGYRTTLPTSSLNFKWLLSKLRLTTSTSAGAFSSVTLSDWVRR